MRITAHFDQGKPTGYVLHCGRSDTRAWAEKIARPGVLADRPVSVVVSGSRLVELIVDCRLIDNRDVLMDELLSLVCHFLPATYWHLWPNNSTSGSGGPCDQCGYDRNGVICQHERTK